MTRLEVGNVFTQITSGTESACFTAYNALSYKVKDFMAIKKRMAKTQPRMRHWDGTKSFFDRRSKQFMTGFLPRVLAAFKADGITFELVSATAKPVGAEITGDIPSLFGITLRDYQIRAINDFFKHRRGVAKLATGAGKCLGKGTPVMMFDGTIKKVEDVLVGDVLMGDDSKPRNVLSTTRGREELFTIRPTKGMSYIVNKSHILSLKATGLSHKERVGGNMISSGDVVDIQVDDYLSLSDRQKHILKGYRVAVDFKQKDVLIDPYFLGLWLGDGRSNSPVICTADKEIVEYINDFASSINMNVSLYNEKSKADSYAIISGRNNNKNKLFDALRGYNLINNKHVPHEYICNDRDTRLKLLAGLVDTDGCLCKGYYEIVFASRELANSTGRLAQSLGFAVNSRIKVVGVDTYIRLTICGDISEIPVKIPRKIAEKRKQKKNVLMVGISVEPIGIGDYYGFEIDGNKRFLLGDCTVTHNTEVAIAIAAKAGVPTIFLTHRVNLLHQTAERFKKRLPHLANKIGIIGNGDCSPNFITIATVQTLHGFIKKDPHATHDMLNQFKLLIIDEAHRSGSKQFYETAQFCSNAHLRLALTATPFMKGNEEEDMYLEGITGGVITSISAGELIEAGVLAKPFFRFIPVDTPLRQRLTNWRDIYELGIVKNVARNKIVVQQTMKLVEMEKKTLVIVHEVTHGKILEKVMHDMGINAEYVDGRNSFTERERALKKLSSGRLDVIICTNIFDEGVDAGEIGAVVLAAGCKSAPALFQRTGRAVRRKEENNFAIIIDFIDKHHPKLLEHSMERYELIKNESGFTIV